MDVWSLYQDRLSAAGNTNRDVKLNRLKDKITRDSQTSLSKHEVQIGETTQALIITSGTDFDTKTVCTIPGEDILCGTDIVWGNEHWLVTETDADSQVYTRGKMQRCNHLLKWVANDGTLCERWCIVSDGTKSMAGQEDGGINVSLSMGDTRISVTLAYDECTAKLSRDQRFIIDDPNSATVLAYKLTKPFKIGGVYNGHGAMTFILSEVNTEDTDNLELRIADYYKYFNRDTNDGVSDDEPELDNASNNTDASGKKVWF